MARCHEVPENLPGKKAENKLEVYTSLECLILGKSTFLKENVDKIIFNSFLVAQAGF